MNMLRRTDILGFPILDETAARVATVVCDELSRGPPKSFVFLNPHSIVVADQDSPLRTAIVDAYGIFCDGVGLALAGRVLNRRRITRVYGYEFFMALSRELSARGTGRVFFLGGSHDSLAELIAKYRAEFPGISSVDSYAPPFKSEFQADEIKDMADRISESGADILWVGLGSPKQEKILHRLMQLGDLSCGAAIGAVFDFYTGRIPHAPAWIRRSGLQWAHRLVLEPKRLWKRTLVSTPLFLWLVLRKLFRPTVPPR
jgi:N-acetylglucosaminyldiphosphoundecaprenol N-acetyl-beta-D-mannosaminyltransferase